MPLYHFYRLVNNVDDCCYIGMTRSELRKRLYEHRTPSSKCSSKQLMEKYGRDNISIVLIHSLEFATNEEAHREERRLIEEYRGRCVNLLMPYRAEEERKEQQKTWRETHKEEVKEHKKAWYETHKEEVKEQRKAYYEANKEEVKEQRKAWRKTHKEEIKEQRKALYEANKEAIKLRRKEARAKAKALISLHTVAQETCP